MPRLRRPFLPLLVLGALSLTGCEAGVVPLATGTIGLGLVPLGNTKKTGPDYVASAITGRDCSIVTLEQTGYYCPPTYEVDRSKLYCYKTLGGIDCHEAPDPYHNGTQSLASAPPVRHEQKNGMLDFIPPLP